MGQDFVLDFGQVESRGFRTRCFRVETCGDCTTVIVDGCRVLDELGSDQQGIVDTIDRDLALCNLAKSEDCRP